MIEKDVRAYADEHWKHQSYQGKNFWEPIREISQNATTKVPLVSSEICMYNFDTITEALLGKKKGTSADGLTFHGEWIEFVEFKSGFHQRITRENFNRKQGTCEAIHDVCKDYWKVFFEKQDRERKILLDSLQMKALESYITLEKEIAPRCEKSASNRSIRLTVVIDADSVESMEDILSDMANQPVENNEVQKVRQSLTRFLGRHDPDQKPYFYNDIRVCSVQEYQNDLKRVDTEKA